MIAISLRTIVAGLLLIVGFTGYVAASANTGVSSSAGEGWGTISGHAITNISYALNGTRLDRLDSVSFDITGAVIPSTVMVRLAAGDAPWHACAVSSGAARVTCDVSGSDVRVGDMDELRVVSAQ